jgi:hypothetical protein
VFRHVKLRATLISGDSLYRAGVLTRAVLIRLLEPSEGPPAVFVKSRRTPQDKLKDLLQGSLRPGQIVNIAADKEVRSADVVNAIDVAEGLDGDVVLLTAAPNSYSAHNW